MLQHVYIRSFGMVQFLSLGLWNKQMLYCSIIFLKLIKKLAYAGSVHIKLLLGSWILQTGRSNTICTCTYRPLKTLHQTSSQTTMSFWFIIKFCCECNLYFIKNESTESTVILYASYKIQLWVYKELHPLLSEMFKVQVNISTCFRDLRKKLIFGHFLCGKDALVMPK